MNASSSSGGSVGSSSMMRARSATCSVTNASPGECPFVQYAAREVGDRRPDHIDLGFEADEIGALDLGVEIGAERRPDEELERDAHVVARLLAGEISRDATHDGLDQVAWVVAPRAEVGADRRDLCVGRARGGR